MCISIQEAKEDAFIFSSTFPKSSCIPNTLTRTRRRGEKNQNRRTHVLIALSRGDLPSFQRPKLDTYIRTHIHPVKMEALGVIFPRGKTKGGGRTTRPSFPPKRLIAPILELAHIAVRLDSRTYLREHDAEQEKQFWKDLPGVEGNCYWNISDDGREWENIGSKEESEKGKHCFDDDEEDGGVLVRGDGVLVPASHNHTREAGEIAADWEVVDHIGSISKPGNTAGKANKVSVPFTRACKGISRQVKERRPESTMEKLEPEQRWTTPLKRPRRTIGARTPARPVQCEQEEDPLPFVASWRTTEFDHAMRSPAVHFHAPGQHPQQPFRIDRGADNESSSSQDSDTRLAEQAALGDFIRSVKSAKKSASSMVSIMTPASRSLSSVLGFQNSFISFDYNEQRRHRVRSSSDLQRQDAKTEFIHRWLMAQARQKRPDHKRIR